MPAITHTPLATASNSAKDLTMKPLATSFTKKGFLHTQVMRAGNVAVYRRQRIGGKAVHFETVIVGSHNGYEIGGVTVEPAETYPSSERWGEKGFTFNDAQAALAKAQTLLP